MGRRLALPLLSLLVVITASLYWPGLSGPFLLDDFSNTVHVTTDTLDPQRLLAISLANDSGQLRRPIANLSFALNAYFGGLQPDGKLLARPYKLTNLIIHLTTGLSLFFLAHRLITHLYGPSTQKRAVLIATAVTGVWLLHPLQVSTVLYVVQRMAQLSALFLVLALASYVYTRQQMLRDKPYSMVAMSIVYLALGSLAVLSKENGALLPLFTLAVETLIFRFQTLDKPSRRGLMLFWIICLALPVALGVFYAVSHFSQLVAGYANRPFTLSERLLTESQVLWYYIKLVFFPHLADMSLYHDDFPIQRVLDAKTVLSISGLAGLIVSVFLLRTKAPLIALGIAWFLISHSLESTFVPLEPVFEHRNYAALFGLLLLPAHLFASPRRLSEADKRGRIYLVAGACFCAILLALTWVRVNTWSDREILIRTMHQYHPQSARLEMELINFDLHRHAHSDAMRRLDRIEQLTPWDPGTKLTRIILECIKDGYDSAVSGNAMEQLQTATVLGTAPGAILKLTNLALRNECVSLPSSDLQAILRTALVHPRVMASPHYHQMFETLLARILAKAGNSESALHSFERGYQARRTNLNPLIEKAYLELNLNHLSEAGQTLTRIREAQASALGYYEHRVQEFEHYLQQALQEVAMGGDSNSANN